MSSSEGSLKSILYALAANAAIALVKTGGAIYTGSASLLAEAVHSYADCGNQGLLLWGMKRSRQAPDEEHPLGYGRAIYFWSFVVAMMLFSLGGLYSVFEGVHKLSAPEPVHEAWVALLILGFGVCAESVSLWGALRETQRERAGRSLWRWFRMSRQSELVVVVGEDVAALGGLALAFFFLLAAWLTGNPLFDALGSIAIGLLLIVVALLVAAEVAALLVGQGVEPQVLRAMHAHLAAQPEVQKVFNVLTQQMGADVMVAVKARMAPQGSEAGLVEAVNRVERSLREAFPQIRWMFFEPDLSD